MGRLRAILVCVAAAGLPLVLCTRLVPAAVPRLQVVQHGRAFSMATLDIVAGTTVDFENQDGFAHQVHVTGRSFVFDSPLQEPDERVAVAFPTPGLFQVRCGVHPRMRLDISVRAAP